MKGNWTPGEDAGGKAASERKPNWLLIKEHDEFERGKNEPCITEEAPNSCRYGSQPGRDYSPGRRHIWNSKESATKTKPWYRQKEKKGSVDGKPQPAKQQMLKE